MAKAKKSKGLLKQKKTFSGTQVLLFVLAFAAVAVYALVQSFAAPRSGSKPSGGGSYTVTISPAGPYNFGESIYVTTNDPIYPNNTGPWIHLKCYQNGVVVASGDHAGFPNGWYYNWPFKLGPTQSWTSGAANCTVTVDHQQNKRVITDATTSFNVNP